MRNGKECAGRLPGTPALVQPRIIKIQEDFPWRSSRKLQTQKQKVTSAEAWLVTLSRKNNVPIVKWIINKKKDARKVQNSKIFWVLNPGKVSNPAVRKFEQKTLVHWKVDLQYAELISEPTMAATGYLEKQTNTKLIRKIRDKVA